MRITKDLFLNTRACPTLGWTLMHAPSIPGARAGDQLRAEMGIEIGERARKLFPGGTLIAEKAMGTAIAKTRTLMDDPDTPAIFEASFLADDFATRADILCRQGGGWRLIEVKSGTGVSSDYINDLMYTAWVLQRAGVDIRSCSLMLVSRDYRLGMAVPLLFDTEDVTEDVFDRVTANPLEWHHVQQTLRAPARPEPYCVWQCRACLLRQDCTCNGIEHPIFDLPRLSETQFNDLLGARVLEIASIPDMAPLSDLQRRVRKAVVDEHPLIGTGLAAALAEIQWPAHYLDFETVATAIPLYPDVAPYEQVTTQYSVHTCSNPGIITGHTEYLADPAHDCQEELAITMIDALSGDGSILAYSPFEKTRINALARRLPHLASDLLALSDRLVDLAKIIRENYYHQGFHGSFSIKKVLPVMIPELTYEGLPIGDGDAAVAAFAGMALGRHTSEEQVTIRSQLLRYCELDTLAMVRLHEKLTELIV